MTIHLELTPEEHAALERRARAGGTTVEAVLRGLAAALARADAPPSVPAPDEDDAEERAERDRERAEIEANVLRWRAERGQA